jgi:hypothetical protein
MMKKLFVFLAATFAFSVHAYPTTPTEISRRHEIALGYGGSTISYAEDFYQNSSINRLAYEMKAVPTEIENTLNVIISERAASEDATFLGGSLLGNPSIQIAPRADGTASMTLWGVSYHTAVRKKIRKLGITWFSCTSNLSLSNVSIKAQYGSADGQFRDDTVGFNGNPIVDTDCDSFLSWLLPGIGNYLTNSVANLADRRLLDGIKSAMGRVKDKLFLRPDQNLLRGLNALIPVDKTIRLPNGNVFPIGQYVRDHIGYLVSNSTLTMQLSRGLTTIPLRENFVGTIVETGDVLYLALDSPVISFDLLLSEKATIEWSYACGVVGYQTICA